MKAHHQSKLVDPLTINYSTHPTNTIAQRVTLSPFAPQLNLKLANCLQTLPAQSTNKHQDTSSDLQSNPPMLTNRTAGATSFQLTTKSDTSLGIVKNNSSIKSYLRIKPDLNVSFLPFEIYQQQSIVFDRAVYKFDRVFESGTKQSDICSTVGSEVTARFMEGYNGTIFAYGSTGSGKTYTMFGQGDGLVPSVVDQVFACMKENWKLSCSMLQIYKETLIDLFCTQQQQDLKIKDINNTCCIPNLTVQAIRSKEETLELISRGNHLKKMRETHLNQASSRSHIVFTLYLEKTDSEGRTIRAKYNLVDLAGSEKVFKSKVEGQGLEEAKKINLSLSCLGNTISALVKNSDHIPYRESKLTRILRESLMGNSITRLIVTCSINEQSLQETISSIKFAQRAQKVQTQAEISYKLNKFKGDKGLKNNQVRLALQQAETKLNYISQKIIESECKICKQVRGIIHKKEKEQLPAEQIFKFKAVDYQSPKARIDLKTFMSNPGSRFSSVPRRQVSKKQSIKHEFGDQKMFEDRKNTNKKIFELKTQNEKLRQEKIVLEGRIKILEDRVLKFEKEGQSSKSCNKKVIKLGQNTQKNIVKYNKQNEPNAENITKDKKSKDTADNIITRNKTEQTTSNPFKQLDRINQLNHVLGLIQETISRFEVAGEEYRAVIRPLEVEVLNQQVSILEDRLIAVDSNHYAKQVHQAHIKIISLHSLFKKSLCSLCDQMILTMSKLFQASASERKQDLSYYFKQREKDISDIKLNIRECFDFSEDLTELQHFLLKQELLARPAQQLDKQVGPKVLQNSYNEFLSMQQYHTL